MLENQKICPATVIGPLGEPLTLDTIPSAQTTRWTIRRKAEVVAAVAGGLLTFDEACDRYALTIQEFATWQRAVTAAGCPACALHIFSDIMTYTKSVAWTDEPGAQAPLSATL